MRISIIGHVASGKSTLAQQISEKLQIPHLHIDKLWFEAGGHMVKENDKEGRERVRAYIQEKVKVLVQQDAWVSDGWYGKVQPIIAERADQIIFLDISLARRLLNHLRRTFFTKRHAELTKWEDLKFTYQIIRRTYSRDHQMKDFVQKNADKVVTLRTYTEVRRYISSLKKL